MKTSRNSLDREVDSLREFMDDVSTCTGDHGTVNSLSQDDSQDQA